MSTTGTTSKLSSTDKVTLREVRRAGELVSKEDISLRAFGQPLARFEARALSREVRIDAPGEFVASVQAELLHRAFENVIRNAIKFTAAGTIVDIRARPDDSGGHLVITVDDRGPGVSEESRERMFDPFVRLEGSESVRGVGLGLAMARRALDVNGGTIKASHRDEGGLRMTLRVPRCARP